MSDEFQAFIKQGTQVLVPPSLNQRVLACKWIFKLKCDSNGKVIRHKARLVTNGYHQQPGLDFKETFSPVIKMTTVRLIMTLALHFSWPIHQLDVKNAFLHGNISEQIHMAQPKGFTNPTRPYHVCLLQKAIYRLRQAPRAWYLRLLQFLVLTVLRCVYQITLFLFNTAHSIVILLMYVDDILLIGSDVHFIKSFLQVLNQTFAMRLLHPLKQFFGIDVTYDLSRVTLSQQNNVSKLLCRASHVLLQQQQSFYFVKTHSFQILIYTEVSLEPYNTLLSLGLI